MMIKSIALIGATALGLNACVQADQAEGDSETKAETIYAVAPGHWTSTSQTEYSADDPSAPYIHDWCLSPDEVTITATDLSNGIAEIIAGDKNKCQAENIQDATYRLDFMLSCEMDDVELNGTAVMEYAPNGKTTDMTVEMRSSGTPEVTFSRIAHQKHLSDTCPPGVE